MPEWMQQPPVNPWGNTDIHGAVATPAAKPQLAAKLGGRSTLLFATIAVAIVATQCSLLWAPLAGIYVNTGAFLGLAIIALLSERARALAISAAVLPVAIMVSLSLPQPGLVAQTVVFYDALLVLTLIYRFIFTLDMPIARTRMGWKGYRAMLPAVLILSQLVAAGNFIALQHHNIFDGISLPLVALCSVVFAFAEEMFFRGLLQQRAARVCNPKVAAVLSTILYGVMTFDKTSFVSPIIALSVGGILSALYYKKENLVITFLVNALGKLAALGLLAVFTLH